MKSDLSKFVEEKYKEYLVRKVDNKKQKKEHKWSVSSVGSCFRKQYYKAIKAEEEPMTYKSAWKINSGNETHLTLSEAIRRTQIDDNKIFLSEVFLESDNLRGVADILVIDLAEKTFSVYDGKELDPFKWTKKFGQKKNREKEESDLNYKQQVAIYAKLVNEQLPGFKPKEVALMYIKRTDGVIRFDYVDIDKYTKEGDTYFRDMQNIYQGIDIEELIPGETIGVPFQSWECRFCQYAHQCPSPFKENK